MQILSPGNILRIPNYEFEGRGERRDKFVIVIDISKEHSLLLRVLTTSKIKVPEDKILHGCWNKPDLGLHFFLFEQDRNIGTSNRKPYCFPKNTFILFRNNIKDINLKPFVEKYKDVVQYICTLNTNEFIRLKKCIRQNERMADRSAKRNFPHIFTSEHGRKLEGKYINISNDLRT